MTVDEKIDEIERKILAYYGKAFYKKPRKERCEICKEAVKRFLEQK